MLTLMNDSCGYSGVTTVTMCLTFASFGTCFGLDEEAHEKFHIPNPLEMRLVDGRRREMKALR